MPSVESAESKAGVLGGFVLSVLAHINTNNLISTAVLAAIGAVVSFVVTLLCKQIQRKCNKPKHKKPSL